jgi:hypothetical protein
MIKGMVAIALLSAGLSLALPARVDYLDAIQTTAASPQSILWIDEFNRAPSGYFEYDSAKGSFVWDDKSGFDGKGAMRATFQQKQVNAGNLKVLLGRNPFGKGVAPDKTFKDLYWRVYLRNESGWEGSPAKLARLTCLAGQDWSQGLFAHVWSGKNQALCIDPATGIRGATKVTTKYNDFSNMKWLGVGHGTTPVFATEESGRWICIESHVRLNTPGQANGVFELWIDGKLDAKREGLDWHGSWTEYGINAFFLENYWNQGAVKAESRWFDSLVIATQRVGPIVSGSRPMIHRTAGMSSIWQVQVVDESDREVWVSPELAANQASVACTKSLSSGTYRTRVREQVRDGFWSAWSPSHCAFTVR